MTSQTKHFQFAFDPGESVYVVLLLKECEHLGLHRTEAQCLKCSNEALETKPPALEIFGPFTVKEGHMHVLLSSPRRTTDLGDMFPYYTFTDVEANLCERPDPKNSYAFNHLWEAGSFFTGVAEPCIFKSLEDAEAAATVLPECKKLMKRSLNWKNQGEAFMEAYEEIMEKEKREGMETKA